MHDLQSMILLFSSVCRLSLVQTMQKKLQTANQLIYVIIMRWTAKEMKMQLNCKCWKVEFSNAVVFNQAGIFPQGISWVQERNFHLMA